MLNLIELYNQGFAPGPNEDEIQFRNRIDRVKALIKDPTPIVKELAIPSPKFEALAPSLLCFRSSKKLPFWFGAMTWICQVDENSFSPSLQLPAKQRFSWIDEDERFSHEKIHAIRAPFNSPQFEEILAYRTSKAKWRSFFGPLFQSSRESYLFLFSAFISFLTPLHLLFTLPFTLYSSFVLFRLFKNQWIFHRAQKRLPKNFPMELLTDCEIKEISRSKRFEFNNNSLRWKLIRELLTRE